MAAKLEPTGNINSVWETTYKPQILQYKRVPLELVAEVLGHGSVNPVKAMLRTNMFPFGCARRDREESENVYEVFPLRFIAWYEGKMQ
jgi:hypothetical protein